MKFEGRETLFQDESDLRHYTGEKAHYLFERDIYTCEKIQTNQLTNYFINFKKNYL